MEKTLLSVADTAETLGISERTLWTLRQQGKIHAVHIGRRVLFAVAEIQRFITEQQREAS
ncbi:MAG TPA: helix-turn-helix domain-containing protein [Pirellulales bacterium]|jgi:excisionase family DNA binding protein|nr:helix-turn-helix domain-containing protein [Pirellulales bacterium]